MPDPFPSGPSCPLRFDPRDPLPFDPLDDLGLDWAPDTEPDDMAGGVHFTGHRMLERRP